MDKEVRFYIQPNDDWEFRRQQKHRPKGFRVRTTETRLAFAIPYTDRRRKKKSQLEPGGYFEAQDTVLPLACDDGTLSEDAPISRWLKAIMQGMVNVGRPLLVSSEQQWKDLMEEVGFEDVSHNVFRWPMNHWPRDPYYKELGMWSLENMDAALEAGSLAPLTRGLGWTKEEVLVLVAQVRKDLRNTKIHAYWPM